MSDGKMWEIEDGFFSGGVGTICGVDEAGRGPLAGPVYAAAVILPPHLDIPGLTDSKKLTDKKRRELFPIIQEQAIAYGIGFATEKEIDEINILQATFLAMERALGQLAVKPGLVLIDGNREKNFGIPVKTVVKGDSLSANIAAASVLLVSLDGHDGSTTLTAVLATFNNIGPGLGLCGPAGNFAFFSPLAKVVLCIDMLLGRLELYPMLVLLMPSTWRKK